MSNETESVLSKIRSNPNLHERAMELALKSNDTSLPPLDRMAAMLELSALVNVVAGDPNLPEVPKLPEYKWVNGARVRVK